MTIRQTSARDLATLATEWANTDYPAALAEFEGAVLGFAVFRELGAGETELLYLEVLPGFRRRGIGRALLARVPGERIFLEVRASNLGAQTLYESAGFQIAGRRKAYYRDTGEDGIVMELKKW